MVSAALTNRPIGRKENKSRLTASYGLLRERNSTPQKRSSMFSPEMWAAFHFIAPQSRDGVFFVLWYSPYCMKKISWSTVDRTKPCVSAV